MPTVAFWIRDPLARSTLAVSAGIAGAIAASLAVRLLLARRLGPEEFGLWVLALALVSAAGGIASLGLGAAAAIRLAPPLEAAAAARGARAAVALAAGSGVLVAAGIALVAPVLAALTGKPWLSGPLLLLAPVVATLAVGNALLGLARARGDVFGRALLRDAGGGLLRLAGVWLGVTAGGGIAGAALGYATGSFLGEGALAIYAWRQGWLACGHPRPDRGWWTSGWAVLRPLSPFVLMAVLAQAVQSFDVLLLGALAPATAVGLYGAARGMIRVLELISEAAGHSFLPMAATAWTTAGATALRPIYLRTRNLVAAGLWTPLAVAILEPAAFLDVVFGPAFAAAATPLRILASGLLFAVLCGYPEKALAASGRPGTANRSLMVGLVGGGAVLLAVWTLVPSWGLGAAAVGWASYIAIEHTLAVAWLWRVTKITPLTGDLVRWAGSCALPTVAAWLLLRAVGVPPWLAVGGVAAVAGCLSSMAVGTKLFLHRRGL